MDGLMLQNGLRELQKCGCYSEERIFEAPVIPHPLSPNLNVGSWRYQDDDGIKV